MFAVKLVLFLLVVECVFPMPQYGKASRHKRGILTKYPRENSAQDDSILSKDQLSPFTDEGLGGFQVPELSQSLSLPSEGSLFDNGDNESDGELDGDPIVNDVKPEQQLLLIYDSNLKSEGEGSAEETFEPSSNDKSSESSLDHRVPETSLFYKVPQFPKTDDNNNNLNLNNREDLRDNVEQYDSNIDDAPSGLVEGTSLNEDINEHVPVRDVPHLQDSYLSPELPESSKSSNDEPINGDHDSTQFDIRSKQPGENAVVDENQDSQTSPVFQPPELFQLYGIPEESGIVPTRVLPDDTGSEPVRIKPPQEEDAEEVPSLSSGGVGDTEEFPEEGRNFGIERVPEPPKKPFAQESLQNAIVVTPEKQRDSQSTLKMGMPFNYDWGVRDPENRNLFSHRTESDGQVTQGEYSVLLPDGRYQIVRYRDEGNGLNVDLTYVNPPQF